MNTSFDTLFETLQGWWDSFLALLPNIVLAAIVLAISIFVVRRIRRLTAKLLRKSSASKNVVDILSNLSAAIFMLLVLFLILSILNLSEAVTALLGTAGVTGLVIGLALQTPLTNLFSGVLISVRDYYKIGDLVETNDYFGTIKQINLRSTIIQTPQGQEVVIPNKDVLQNPLTNYSHSQKRRVDLTCGVGYGSDLELVKRVAKEAIEQSGMDIKETKPVEVFFTDFGDSSINFVLRFWKNCTGQADYLAAQDQAIIALKKRFDEHEINIPFPIRTIEFARDTAPARVIARTMQGEMNETNHAN
ncbi:MAG: mechanosensitive ion channel [Saprospiraceae bacterium]|nr:mechanosensitive ion channel [Saprospiraceae bacterium]